jgi:hypothetical protein
MTPRRTAALLVAAAVLTNVAFTALGAIFDYPDVLQRPVPDILAAFRASEAAIVTWFTVLALSAALFAPIAVGVGRLSRHRSMRAAVPVGVAAAVVQVVGLARWPLLIPGYARSDDLAAFETAHRVLGMLIGETLGYSLTAAWTVLVLIAAGRPLAGRWFTLLGGGSAVLIALGVLTPLGVPGTDTANFAGYVLWSAWLVAFAVLLIRRPAPDNPRPPVPGAGTVPPARPVDRPRATARRTSP